MPPLLLDREEAASTLRVSVSTLDRLVKSGRLKAVRPDGRRPKFRLVDLEAFVAELAGEAA